MNIPSRTIERRATNKGFTIIETLVAITILMIAVAGPLVIATKGLTSSLVSKDQMVASYLAQDTMETIKNRRDSNVANNPGTIETSWLIGFGSTCNSLNATCDINGVDGISGSTYVDDVDTCASGGCDIYYDNATGYNHNSIGSKTIFHRQFYFETPAVPRSNGKSERLVHVFVDWFEGTVPYQIHLTSQLTAASR